MTKRKQLEPDGRGAEELPEYPGELGKPAAGSARGPGRPATGARVKKVSITIPTELWRKAERFAFVSGLPLSGVISEALARHLEAEDSRAGATDAVVSPTPQPWRGGVW